MRWVNSSDYKAWTKSDMKGALKRFQKWVNVRNLDRDVPFPPRWRGQKLRDEFLKEKQYNVTIGTFAFLNMYSLILNPAFARSIN